MLQSMIGGDLTVKSGVTGGESSQTAAPGPIIPQLPIATVDVTFPDTSAYSSVTTSSVSDLQAQVTKAACNTVINIPPGSVYNTSALDNATGLVLPAISCKPGQWIIVQTANAKEVRGVRIDPSLEVGTMAKLTTAGTTERIISCAANVPCGPFWFYDIELDYTGNTSAVFIVNGTDIPANLPNYLIFDHIYAHGRVANQTTHGFFVNANNFAIVDSWLSDFHDAGNDSQAFNPYAGGPMLLQNDFIEAAGENRLSMGGTNGQINLTAGVMPHDITETHNWYFKPLQWLVGSSSPIYEGVSWDVKNIWESKACVRCVLQESILENNWIANQVGKAVLDNQAPSTNGKYSYTSDTTYQYLWIIGGAAFAFANAKDGTGGPSPNDPTFSPRMDRVMWRNILVENLRSSWCATGAGCPSPQNYMGIGNSIYGVIISHVTVTSAPAQFNSIEDEGNGYQRAITYVTDNIFPQGVNGGYKTAGFPSNSIVQLNKVWGVGQDPTVTRNVFPGMPVADVNTWNSTVTNGVHNFTGTSGPASQQVVGYTKWVDGPGGSYQLVPGSQFSATGANPCKVNVDGSGGNADCGADVTTIMARTAGIQTVPSLWPDSRSGGGILPSPSSLSCNGANTVTITAVAGAAGGSAFVLNGLDVMFNGKVIAPISANANVIVIQPPQTSTATVPLAVSNFGLPLTANVACN
jgi:hypothetical protein